MRALYSVLADSGSLIFTGKKQYQRSQVSQGADELSLLHSWEPLPPAFEQQRQSCERKPDLCKWVKVLRALNPGTYHRKQSGLVENNYLIRADLN